MIRTAVRPCFEAGMEQGFIVSPIGPEKSLLKTQGCKKTI